MAQPGWLQHYASALENLSPDRLNDLEQYLADDLQFSDPFNHLHTRDAFIALMDDMYARLDEVGFKVHSVIEQQQQGYLYWTYSASSSVTGRFSIQGVSRVEVNEAGKIRLHEDYWDGSRLMQTLPLLGRVVAWVRRKLACPGQIHV